MDINNQFNEEFPIRESMSVEEIENYIKWIVEKFNNSLRPGESPRKFVRLVGYVPMLETRMWYDDKNMDKYIPITPFIWR